MKQPEDSLFEAWCRAGDARSLSQLFDRTAPRLLRLGVHLVGDAAEAEDFVQAAFLALIEQRTEIDGTRPAWPWLASVVAHKAQDSRRRANRSVDVERLIERVWEDPVEPLGGSELSGELAAAIDRLDEPYRQVLMLRLRDDLATPDIAHALDRSPGTVRVQMHRAVEKLRPMLSASLAVALALECTAGRGLAAVRAVVTRRAANAARTTTVAGASVGAWLASHKLVAATFVAALALVVGFGLRGPVAAGDIDVAKHLEVPAERPPVPSQQPRLDPVESVGTERAPAQVEERAYAWLSGTVSDAETGEPIAGVTVRLHAPRRATMAEIQRANPALYYTHVNGRLYPRTQGDWPSVMPRASDIAQFGGEELLAYDEVVDGVPALATTETDDAGHYRLPIGREGGLLECTHDGYGRRLRVVEQRRSFIREHTRDVGLRTERRVTGRVVTRDGEAPGVPLQLAFYALIDDKDMDAISFLFARPTVPGVSHSAPPVLHGKTDALGLWTCETSADGTFEVTVAADSVVPSILTAGWSTEEHTPMPLDGPLRVVAYPAPVLRVFDAGTSAPIERVRLLSSSQTSGQLRWTGEFYAPGGALELPGGPNVYGSWGREPTSLAVWAEGYAATRFVLEELSGSHDVALVPGTMTVVEGYVRRGAEPATGAVVAILAPRASGLSSQDAVLGATSVDDKGYFSLSAPVGTFRLRVKHDGAELSERIVLPATGPFDVDLGTLAQLAVTVVEPDGKTRVKGFVTLRDGGSFYASRSIDRSGVATFKNLRPQRYTVSVRLGPSRPGRSLQEEVVVEAGADQAFRIDLAERRGPDLRFVDARVASFEGWRVRSDRGAWQALGIDGSVPTDLRAGAHWIELEGPDSLSWSLHLPPQGEPFPNEVELDAGSGAYRGVLRGTNGEFLTGWRMTAEPMESKNGAYLASLRFTDDSGRFDLDSLAGCRHSILIQPPSRDGAYRFEPTEAASRRPMLDLVLPAVGEIAVFSGTVLQGPSLEPMRDVAIVVVSREPVEGGSFIVHSRAATSFGRTDGLGRFSIRIHRTASHEVRVRGGSPETLLHTVVFDEPLPADGEGVEIVVP